MCLGISSKKVFKETISNVNLVHFYLLFGLSVHGLEIAEQLQILHTAALQLQPENNVPIVPMVFQIY